MRQLTNAFPTSLIGDPFYIAMPPPHPLPLIRIILPNSCTLLSPQDCPREEGECGGGFRGCSVQRRQQAQPGLKMSLSDCEWECTSNTSGTSARGEEAFARKKAGVQKGELNSLLIEYINEWRKTREKDEEELRKLKEKQLRRKEVRAEQERVINAHKKEDEDRLRKEEMDRREAEVSDKKKQLEEAEVKRQAMLELQKKTGNKREKASVAMGAMSEARREMSKTREQLEEEKNLALSIRIKPIDLDVLDSYELEQKATELYNIVVALETDKYDMEQRALNQEYELTELKERQRLQLRQKAVKKGLDPDALSGKHPPKVRMYDDNDNDNEAPAQGEDVLEVREEDGHEDLRGQEDFVRRRLGGGAGLHGRAVVDREVRGVGKEACPSSAEVTVVKESYILQN